MAQLDVDVLGIQEVDAAQERSGMVDQTAAAARAMGAEHWRFVPTVVGTPGPGASFRPAPSDIEAAQQGSSSELLYRVGLISRIPVLRWHHLLMDPAKITMPLLIPETRGPRSCGCPTNPSAVVAAVLDLPDARDGGYGPSVVRAGLQHQSTAAVQDLAGRPPRPADPGR